MRPKLVENQRSDLRLLDYNDTQYRKMLRGYEEMTALWMNSPRSSPPGVAGGPSP
jgi:hypothetical protein